VSHSSFTCIDAAGASDGRPGLAGDLFLFEDGTAAGKSRNGNEHEQPQPNRNDSLHACTRRANLAKAQPTLFGTMQRDTRAWLPELPPGGHVTRRARRIHTSRLTFPRMSYSARSLLWLRAFLLLFAVGVSAHAQNSVSISTNFYAASGSNFREIRRSIEQARPWKDNFDGDTRWEINWKYTTTQGPGGCTPSGFSTTTKIVVTLPRWTPPPDVLSEVKTQWTRYFTNLAQHEAGHARLGLAAAAEVQKQIAGVGTQADCAQLRQLINDRANAVVADYRRREVEYDKRTDHGRQPAGAR
jgi:predicted secreted Zn-dependent protease